MKDGSSNDETKVQHVSADSEDDDVSAPEQIPIMKRFRLIAKGSNPPLQGPSPLGGVQYPSLTNVPSPCLVFFSP